MKKSIILSALILMLFAVSCRSGHTKQSDENAPSEISFESKEYDFGTIPYSSDGRCYFKFTNTSDVPLIVNVVRTTCGCTRPEWPEKPVQPGETGEIGITYNTRITGAFRKTITVYSNAADSPTRLMIKGTVSAEPEQKKNN